MFQLDYVKEKYLDANPFQFVPALDKVVYCPQFSHINQARFNPENKDKLDADRICKLTSWTPDSTLKLDHFISENVDDEFLDRIDLLF